MSSKSSNEFSDEPSGDDLAVIDLCRKCRGIAAELLTRLNRVKVREGSTHRNWQSFKTALRATWGREEMDTLANQLSEIRSEIEFRVLLNFRETIKSVATRQAQTSHQLTESTQSIINTFLSVRDEFATELQRQAGLLARLQGDKSEVRLAKHGTLQTLDYQDNEGEENALIRGRNSATETLVQEQMTLIIVENSILANLDFATIRDRHEDLEIAHNQTFEWVFKDASIKDRGWSNFVEWLRHDNGLYWVSGKAGSGKSTLMKYIYNHRQTRLELAQWAGFSPFDITGFFFWNSGSEEQRSQRGLLRTLLFETLQTHRELIPKVFPTAWAAWSAKVKTALKFGTGSAKASLIVPEMKVWSLSQLKRAFRNLVDHCRQNSIKLCFIIDGLDEYDGDHDEIADYFTGFSNEPNMKMCISSRPLVVFEEAFDKFPGLKLQNLTHGDISQYVEDNLANHRHMAALTSKSPDQAVRLVGEIVNKADGVFLWVKLVVKSLLQGLRDRNRISDLQKRLRHLPADLEALYEHMLEKMDPFYLEQASQIFQIVLIAQKESVNHQITLLQLSWAEEEDESFAMNATMRPLSEDEIIARCKLMDTRLKSVCSGLLESYDSKYSNTAPDARVVCLHRTVSDFFKKPTVWQNITRHTKDSDFSPHMCLLRSCVLQLKAFKGNHQTPLDMSILRNALRFAQQAEADLGTGFPVLLDQLDAAATYQWRVCDGRSTNAVLDHHRESIQSRKPRTSGIRQSHFTSELLAESENESDHYFDCRSSNEMSREYKYQDTSEKVDRSTAPPSKDILQPASSQPTKASHRIEIALRSRDMPNFEKFEEETRVLRHWTYGIQLPEVRSYRRGIPFYDLAKALGLNHYIAHKDQTGVMVDHDVNHHMLMHNVTIYSRPRGFGESQVPDLAIVERTLTAGADPNFAYEGSSPWEEVLTGFLSHISRYEFDEELWDQNTFRGRQWMTDARKWCAIMKVFLDHGADCAALSKLHYGQQRRRPLAIVHKMPPSLASESRELVSMIHSSLNIPAPEKHSPDQSGVPSPENTEPKSAVKVQTSERAAGGLATYSWVVSWLSGRKSG
ncbi:P-loop containing nucleoside triphosphate hydrolase [Glarea lozoyensis ATCC 20868]|uniref:p-loop containing nucleoside triphosphate hydrolase n=1 Tax=Glarea lozoyensis (strain ATCC 20868 / MF5171) TaxID=1116229 RepID=S3DEC1_GLAL2|nr:P-loop containing nucleoside triphosphate hydrolase [Glarea lozoyensis ATCC 20868]EPE30296.1 P-loop containing nucleoside triphosphate hydrolase [Glarea lozoyensis ATCC 20868]